MKKGVSVILIIVVLLLCCCVVALVGGFYIVNSVVAQTEPVQDLAYQLCTQKNNLSTGTYESLFTEDFKDITTLSETEDFLNINIPSDFNCNELKGNNIITLVMKGYAISSETNMDETIADYKVKLDDETLTFYYRYENDKWYVEGIYID